MKKEKHTWQRAAYMSHLPSIETSGYRVGLFGLHKGKGGWFVTHLPTGKGVHLLDRPTLAAAVTAVTRAQEESAIRWGHENETDMLKELRKAGPDAIQHLRAF